MKKKINQGILFSTFLLLILNIHGKHIEYNITEKQKRFLKKPIFRDILIFLLSYTACENLYFSILFVLIYTLLFDHLLNENTQINKIFFSN